MREESAVSVEKMRDMTFECQQMALIRRWPIQRLGDTVVRVTAGLTAAWTAMCLSPPVLGQPHRAVLSSQ